MTRRTAPRERLGGIGPEARAEGKSKTHRTDTLDLTTDDTE